MITCIVTTHYGFDLTAVTAQIPLEVRASASGGVDLGLTPSRVKPVTLKFVFTASLLDAQH